MRIRWGSTWVALVASAPAIAVAMGACQGGSGSGSGGSGSGSHPEVCEAACQARMAADCAADNYTECVALCEMGIEDAACGSIYEELQTCVGALPPDGFVCTDDGQSVMVQTSCTIEFHKISDCVASTYDAAYYADATAGWYCPESTSTDPRLCTCIYTVLPAEAQEASAACDPALGCCNTLGTAGMTSCTCTDLVGAECDEQVNRGGEYSTRVPSCPAE